MQKMAKADIYCFIKTKNSLQPFTIGFDVFLYFETVV